MPKLFVVTFYKDGGTEMDWDIVVADNTQEALQKIKDALREDYGLQEDEHLSDFCTDFDAYEQDFVGEYKVVLEKVAK